MSTPKTPFTGGCACGAVRYEATAEPVFTLHCHCRFCPECGAPVVVKPDAVPNIVAIRTASLDDPSWFKPQVDVWTCDAHPWDHMNAALPKFEKYPK